VGKGLAWGTKESNQGVLNSLKFVWRDAENKLNPEHIDEKKRGERVKMTFSQPRVESTCFESSRRRIEKKEFRSPKPYPKKESGSYLKHKIEGESGERGVGTGKGEKGVDEFTKVKRRGVGKRRNLFPTLQTGARKSQNTFRKDDKDRDEIPVRFSVGEKLKKAAERRDRREKKVKFRLRRNPRG